MYDKLNVIGSDEAGVGDYFGPMTVCACVVDSSKVPLLKSLGVKDSKNLSNSTVNKLAREIIHVVPYSLVVLNNEKYNERIEAGWNVVQLKAVLHNHCIKNVYHKTDIKIDNIVIDQFTTEHAYKKYVKEPFKEALISQETKAESKSIAVSCASIIARSKYLEQMATLNKNLNKTVPRGASKAVDEFAAQLASTHGMDFVDSITKKHFKTREKVLKLLN